jgi:predicted homoserine dehydrogenase-like protein
LRREEDKMDERYEKLVEIGEYTDGKMDFDVILEADRIKGFRMTSISNDIIIEEKKFSCLEGLAHAINYVAKKHMKLIYSGPISFIDSYANSSAVVIK